MTATDFSHELHEAQRTRDHARVVRCCVAAGNNADQQEEALKCMAEMLRADSDSAAAAQRFTQHGACEEVCRILLSAEEEDGDVQLLWSAFRALGWLCAHNSEARHKLGELGACELVVRGMQRCTTQQHRNALDYGCFAISSLANNSHHNKHKLVHAGAAQVIQDRCGQSDMRRAALSRLSS